MSKSLKRKLSGLIAFVMLFTTVFSNVMTAFADTDNSFNVLLDDVAVGGVVKSGYVEGTGNSVKLYNGAGGETDWKVKSQITLESGKINVYHAGNRDNDFLKDTTHKLDGSIDTIPENGQKVLFTAPANGIFLTYISAGKGVYVYEYGTDRKLIQKIDNSGVMIDPSLAFKVESGHSYVITTTTGTNNCWYGGFKFMQDTPVNLNVVMDESNTSMNNSSIEFINDATKLVEATISDSAVNVTLTKNNTYTVRSQSINKKVTVNGSTKFTVDGSDLNIKIEDTNGITVSGPITSDSSEFDISDIESITFKSTSWSGDEFTFNAADCISSGSSVSPSYTVSLLPSEYETSVTTKSGNYKTYDHVSVPESGSVSNEIYLEYEYSGGYVEAGKTYTLPEEIIKENSLFTFNNIKANNDTSVRGGDGSTITFPVNGKVKITVSGWFSGTWNINGNDNVTADGSHSVSSPQVNTYVTNGPGTVTIKCSGSAATYLYQIKVEQAEATPVKGGIYYLPAEFENAKTKFKFENVKKNNDQSIANAATNSTISFDINGPAKIKVGGWYEGTWNINGNEDVTIIEGQNGGYTNCLYNEYEATSAGAITITTTGTTYLYTVEVTYNNPDDEPASGDYKWSPTVNVPEDYATLTEAVKAIKDMDRPEGEEGRVTINLNKDTEEQVLMDAPYVSLNGNGHTVSWYYFTIGSYYSCDSEGYYSERLFRDKYSKNPASGSLWGGVVIVKGDYFKAENVTFLNTCNYYVTDKEIEDGAEDTVLGLRTKGMDVQVYADKERGNALYTDANYGEYYNCKILSSQDTLGVNGSRDTYQYFKDCVIGGNVDYICGAGTMVFDDCELQWKTYSDVENGKNNGIGYIVAPKTNPYVFRNCTVTTDGKEGDAEVMGMYGRTWGAGSKAYFINTNTNGLVKGWGEMNKGDNTTAEFYEYNNVISNDGVTSGAAIAPEGYGQALTDKEKLTNVGTDAIINNILNGWTPVHYVAGDRIDSEVTPEYNFGVSLKLTGATANDAADMVASGGSLEIDLTANEGFELPETVEVTGGILESYEVAADKSTATVKIKEVTGNVTLTVVATAKKPIYKVTMNLSNLTSTPIVEEVVDGSDIEITLTAAEGYELPETVTVTGGTAAYDKATGVLKITGITGDVTITASATAKKANYSVTMNLSNITATPVITEVIEGSDIEITLTAAEGYGLPETVTVTGGTAAYDKATGVLKITGITGDVTITANAVQSTFSHLTGDVTHNKVIDSTDAALIISSSVGLGENYNNNADMKIIANVDGKGDVDSTDAALVITKANRGSTYTFPIGDTVQVSKEYESN